MSYFETTSGGGLHCDNLSSHVGEVTDGLSHIRHHKYTAGTSVTVIGYCCMQRFDGSIPLIADIPGPFSSD